MNRKNFYIPLCSEVFPCYRQWMKKMIAFNTLFTAPDEFIRNRCTAILLFNFSKIYPKSISVVLIHHESEVDEAVSHCKVVGFNDDDLQLIKEDKAFCKLIAEKRGKVFFMSSKVIANLVGKDRLNGIDLKLLVVPDAVKASSNNGLAKLVSQVIQAGKLFRVFAHCHILPKQIAKVQSMISNLAIHKLLTKNANDVEMEQILFSKDAEFTEFEFSHPILESFRLAILTRASRLRAWKLINETNPDVLIYSEVDDWKDLARKANPEKEKDVILMALLIQGYRLFLFYGLRAVFLFFSSKFKSFPFFKTSLEEDSDLSELKESLETVSFDAFPGKKYKKELNTHPKFNYLSELVSKLKEKRKAFIFCSSPFGARSVSEFLKACQVQIMEHIPEYYQQMKNVEQTGLIGPEMINPELTLNKFLPSEKAVALVATTDISLGKTKVDLTVSMDYCVSSYHFTKYGKKRHCLLTQDFENISEKMRCFDKKDDVSKSTAETYNFRKEASKLTLKRPLADFPVEYTTKQSVGSLQIAVDEPPGLLSELERIEMLKTMKDPSLKQMKKARKQFEGFMSDVIPKPGISFKEYFQANYAEATEFEKALYRISAGKNSEKLIKKLELEKAKRILEEKRELRDLTVRLEEERHISEEERQKLISEIQLRETQVYEMRTEVLKTCNAAVHQ
uniref:Helicase C-terminal domain-containing protein n=1 Tax=Panagrolaimus sp. JU765 TaxID=591449 RepID=A0AC34RIN9_9BILA